MEPDCDLCLIQGVQMKLTALGRLHWPVASSLLWVSAGTACRGESPVPSLSSATFGQAAQAAVADSHLSLKFLQTIVLISALTFTGMIVISLMVMLVTSTTMARGGTGHRIVVFMAVRLSLTCSHVLRSAAFISCILSVLEISAVFFYPSLGAWCSCAAPLLFTLLLIAATNFSIVRKEEQLRLRIALSEGTYRMLFERILVGAYQATLDGRILDCNFSFCQIFGYASCNEVIANSVSVGYLNARDRERFDLWLGAKKRLTNFEQCLRRKDGSTAWVLNTATLAWSETANEPVVKGTMRDISELRLDLPAWLRKMADFLVAVRWSFSAASQL